MSLAGSPTPSAATPAVLAVLAAAIVLWPAAVSAQVSSATGMAAPTVAPAARPEPPAVRRPGDGTREGVAAPAPALTAPIHVVPAAVRGDAGTGPGAKAAVCAAPASLARIDAPLRRTGKRLAAGQPIKIVAIGSSSTAGAGATAPEFSYPTRLAVELRQRFPGQDITVVNRGVNGEEADQMIGRFEADVIAEHPDLVLWQVGTNSVLRDHPIAPAGLVIQRGLEQLKATGADVVIMDPQFAPKVIAKPDAEKMVDLLARAAKHANVHLFRRFAVMRHWRDADGIPFERFVSADDLHLNDWSYGCVAKVLAGSIAEAATRATAVARRP
jgi:lysophospholipase L1-like esterase